MVTGARDVAPRGETSGRSLPSPSLPPSLPPLPSEPGLPAHPSLPQLPAIVVGEVRHERRTPIRHTVRMRTHLWLVDLAALPRSRPWRSFAGADHFRGDEGIRAGLQRFVEAQGESIGGNDRVVMLAAARSLGHVFNPLSVFWCLGPDGAARWAVLEIHNTYGERHAQLLQVNDKGVGHVPKEFYVSPFFAVAGGYRVRLTLTDRRVAVSVTLVQGGLPVFVATFTGTPSRATARTVVRAELRTPLASRQTVTRIRWHGIRLWLRLPVVPRRPHTPPRGLG